MVFAKEQGTVKPQLKNINPTGISRETALKGKITATRNMPVLINAKAAIENRKILSSEQYWLISRFTVQPKKYARPSPRAIYPYVKGSTPSESSSRKGPRILNRTIIE